MKKDRITGLKLNFKKVLVQIEKMTSRMGSQTIDDLPDHEKLVPCPYNKAHKVVSSR